MQPLLPPCIQSSYPLGQMDGQFEAVALSVDISGFTQLTRTLMQHRKDGAEVLTDVLNRIFNALVEQVTAHGGFVSSFAGDAFTALFPTSQPDAPHQAVQVAFAIRQFFAHHRIFATKYGDFTMQVKVGLGVGTIRWGIVRAEEPERAAFFFCGDGIRAALRALNLAQGGDLVAAPEVMPLLGRQVEADRTSDHFRLRSSLLALPPAPLPPPPLLPADALAPFMVEEVLASSKAEFREVCSIFISFSEPADEATLHSFVSTVMQLTGRYGGYFNKVDFGDKGWVILVLFGAPWTYENSVERASDFLLALRTVPIRGIAWRAGLTWGTVYAGIVGGEARCEYTAIGTVVNLAARMMMQASWGEVWVPEAVARHPGFTFTHQGDFFYKGFDGALPTYALQSERSAEQKFFDQGLVGRHSELAALYAHAAPLFDGHAAGVIYLYGEAGVGKSHLAYEFHKLLAQQHDLTWFTTQTDPVSRTPFNPFGYFLRHYFRQSPDASPEENKARFTQRLDALLERLKALPGWDEDHDLGTELARTASVLGALVGLQWSGSLYQELDALGRYQNTIFAVKTLLQAESRFKPVVLLLEDAHALDDASQALLTTLTRTIGSYPLLILATLRYADDGTPRTFPLDKQVPTAALHLKFLQPADTCLLAESALGAPPDEALVALLLDKTQGNPFYVRQYLHYFTENGWLLYRDGCWGLREMRSQYAPDVPATINAILVARLDRLSPAAKTIIKLAAVLGHEFEIPVLAEVLRREPELAPHVPHLSDHVHEAEREQVWIALSDSQYIFKHSLMRDSAYDIQLPTRLRDLHRLAAEAYESLYRDNLTPYHATLAHHYQRAALPAKARVALTQAGQSALAISAYREAVDFLSQALALLPESAQAERSDEPTLLHRLLGEALIGLGRFEEAMAHLERSLALAQSLGDAAGMAAAFRGLGFVLTNQGNFERAEGYLLEGLTLGKTLDDAAGQAHTLYNLGFAVWRQGRTMEGEEYLAQSLTLARRASSRRDIARALTGLGNTALMRRSLDEAAQHFEESLALSRVLGDKSGLGRVLNNLAIVASRQKQYSHAMSLYQEALAILREIDNRPYLATCLNDLGHTALQLKDWAAAERYLRQSIEEALGMGSIPTVLSALVNLAALLLERGEAELAATYLNLALHHPHTHGDLQQEAHPIMNRLRAALPHHLLVAALERGNHLDLEQGIRELLARPRFYPNGHEGKGGRAANRSGRGRTTFGFPASGLLQR